MRRRQEARAGSGVTFAFKLSVRFGIFARSEGVNSSRYLKSSFGRKNYDEDGLNNLSSRPKDDPFQREEFTPSHSSL